MPSPSSSLHTPQPPHSKDAPSISSTSHPYHRPSCQTDTSQGPCEHGLLSPNVSRPGSSLRIRERGSYRDDDGDNYRDANGEEPREGRRRRGHGEDGGFGGKYAGKTDLQHRVLGDAVADGILGSGVRGGEGHENSRRGGKDREGGSGQAGSTTQWLASIHGINDRRKMYLAYYVPFFTWITQYRWSFLQGDLIAALTIASFYIPMSLSYAENLGHLPPINGLYSFVFNPFIYAFLGSCPQMVVGPEAAGSLLVGTVVRGSVDRGQIGDEDAEMNAKVAGVVTGIAGAVIFIAGITRLGFLDSVLSRPFLRGFISAIGFVILVDQLIPEMGLQKRAKHVGGVGHGSSMQKLMFLGENMRWVHGLTCGVAFGSFAIIMVCRCVERSLGGKN